jgi:hypothetical protein
MEQKKTTGKSSDAYHLLLTQSALDNLQFPV